MYYGELAEKNASYQSGHSTGSIRAFDSAINHFDKIAREEKDKLMKQKFSAEEVVKILQNRKLEWIEHCDTFGMGKEEE